MEKFKLQLEKREQSKPNQLRREGKVPATLYGPGVESLSFQVDAKEFSRLPSAAYSHIIELEGQKEGSVNAIIRHVQRRATTHEVLNIELYRVAADRKITVTVPLKLTGVSPAVQKGGQIQFNHEEAEVECFPGDIPDFLTVDISVLVAVDTGIHFSELQIPSTVKILNPAEEIVVRIVAPKAAAAEDKAATAAAAAAPAAAAGATAQK